MKVKIQDGKALITAGMNTPLNDYLKKAEEDFLKDVMKGLKKVVGSKVKMSVKGGTVVYLDGKGVNTSDHEVSFLMHLIIKDFDAKLYLKFEDVMRGRSEDTGSYKTGTLTPNEAVSMFKRYWR